MFSAPRPALALITLLALAGCGGHAPTTMTSPAPEPFAGLPPLLAPLHRRVSALVERLPAMPPSFAAARALNRWLLPRLPADARAALQGRVVALHVTDFGLRVRLALGERGFDTVREQRPEALRISATSAAFVRLARGEDDADRLFFERQLSIEGDTELGLMVKNTLDAIGPLWPQHGR